MRRTRKTINQINVVPYIDVMLVLLVIFMVTAPLINPGSIDLPSVGSKLTVPATPMEVTLHADGTWVLDGQAGGDAGSQGVARRARRARQGEAGPPSRSAGRHRRVRQDARYEEVLKVLDLLQTSGVQKVGLLARPTGS